MPRLTDPRAYHPSVKFLLLFLGSLALFFFLVTEVFREYILSDTTLHVTVAELGVAGLKQPVPVDNDRVVELVFMGPVHALLFFAGIKILLARVDRTDGHNKYWATALEFLAVLLACALCMGHVWHLWFDRANALYRATYPGYDTSEAFLFIYFSDEWLGHAIVHLSFFAGVVIALGAELKAKTHDRVRVDEFLIAFAMGITFGIVNSIAARQSESAFPLLVASIVLLAVLLVYGIARRLDLRAYPILLACIVGCVFAIVYNVAWVVEHGVLDHYPFIR